MFISHSERVFGARPLRVLHAPAANGRHRRKSTENTTLLHPYINISHHLLVPSPLWWLLRFATVSRAELYRRTCACNCFYCPQCESICNLVSSLTCTIRMKMKWNSRWWWCHQKKSKREKKSWKKKCISKLCSWCVLAARRSFTGLKISVSFHELGLRSQATPCQNHIQLPDCGATSVFALVGKWEIMCLASSVRWRFDTNQVLSTHAMVAGRCKVGSSWAGARLCRRAYTIQLQSVRTGKCTPGKC